MSISLSIPTGKSTGELKLTINSGEILFILGANGTGKSSLMQAFTATGHANTRRITAHRQTWFRSGSPEFTGKQRADYEQNVSNFDNRTSARWMDDYAEARTQMAIYDLVSSENLRAREIARAVDAKKMVEADELATKGGAISTLNRLLKLANIDIVISIKANDEIVAVRSGSVPYSISKLSDGERNAILIAANVLTAPLGTLLLIDEPERHLHRSIVSPLLSLLLKERPDSTFIVSTHEPMLPIDNPGSKVLLTRACAYADEQVTYDIDFLKSSAEIDEDLIRTILGERRKIIFVEGTEQSLDKPLYSLLFPNASIVPKASCRDVESAVVGITGAAKLHWVQPFGLVDNDSTDAKRIEDLRNKGIGVLNVYSVESIYYHPEVQKLAGEKLVGVVGGDLTTKLENANNDAIKAISNNSKRLSERISEKAARVKVFTLLPKQGEMAIGAIRNVEIDFGKYASDEAMRLKELIDNSDFLGMLQRYPIRETAALDAIAKALNFANRAQYEAAVLNILSSDSEAVKLVRSLLGELPIDLTAQ